MNKLSAQVGKALLARQQTVVVAESCTGGGLAECLTRIPGSSAWFDRGWVTYSNQAKMDLLGVSATRLDEFGAVSAEIAQDMVSGALAGCRADWAVSITGIAGPGGATEHKPVGTVFIAWASRQGELQVERHQFVGTRQQIRQASIRTALQRLLQMLTAP